MEYSKNTCNFPLVPCIIHMSVIKKVRIKEGIIGPVFFFFYNITITIVVVILDNNETETHQWNQHSMIRKPPKSGVSD